MFEVWTLLQKQFGISAKHKANRWLSSPIHQIKSTPENATSSPISSFVDTAAVDGGSGT